MGAAAFVTGASFARGASPLGLPDTLSRAPLRRRAPFAWLRSLCSLALLLIVLAVFARCAPELPPEFARKVALICEAAIRGDFGQRFIREHQGATRKAQPKLAQKSLRGEMEGGTELPFERAERHVRNGREVPIGDLVMKFRAHMSQCRPEARGGCFETARGSGGASNPGRPNDCAFRIDDRDLVGNVPDRRALRFSDSFEPTDNAVTGQNLFIIVSELIGQERRG